MGSSASGFRVLDEHDTFLSIDPNFVIYRLDLTTLEFSEVSGHPERLLGFPPADWYRPGFWSGRIHPEDQEPARAFLASWAEVLRDEQLEYRVIDASGRTVWVHQIISVGHDARREMAVRGVLIDVTGRIAREADVEKALFLKAELFRILAEELAPPVRATSAYGHMLERHLAAQRDDVGSDYAVAMRDGLQRLDELLAQLMRITQGSNLSIDELNANLAALRRGDLGG